MATKPTPTNGSLELVVFLSAVGPMRFPLPEAGKATIGRDDSNHIVIPDDSVSRRHAILHVGPTLTIEDLKSQNGIAVRESRKRPGTAETERDNRRSGVTLEVKVGARILIGSVMAVVQRAGQVAKETTATSAIRPIVREPSMVALYEKARRVAAAKSTACVLILGETGVGKDVLAQAIHQASPRATKRIIEVNCANMQDTLLESELFGHTPGAFTDAKTDKKGFFELAHEGTLFLDEIGEVSAAMQAKLLRVVETGKFYRMGDPQLRSVDVRIIAATNRDLKKCSDEGTFRRDLYHRLRGIVLEVPPLRERPTEVLPLAEKFLAEECARNDREEPLRLSPEAMKCLEEYDFPGNVRELRNAMVEVAVLCESDMVSPEDLPSTMRRSSKGALVPQPSAPAIPGADTDLRGQFEYALWLFGGNQKKAAEWLKIPRRTFVNILNKLPIPRPRKKQLRAESNHSMKGTTHENNE